MMNLFKHIFIVFMILSSNCYSVETFDVDKTTKIDSIKIFIYPFNGTYPIYGDLNQQIEVLRNNAGLKIQIDSILQIVQYEQKLKFNNFKPIIDYNEFIKDFQAYVLFNISIGSKNIILVYDGEYLLDCSNKKYRKINKTSLLNFDPFGD